MLNALKNAIVRKLDATTPLPADYNSPKSMMDRAMFRHEQRTQQMFSKPFFTN